MSVTILEALQNARYNLIDNSGVPVAERIGREQLNNAVTLLEKGYDINEDFNTVMAEYDHVDKVPEKENA